MTGGDRLRADRGPTLGSSVRSGASTGRRITLSASACVLCVLALATHASARKADRAMVVVDGPDLRGPALTLERPHRFELRSNRLKVVFFSLTWRHWGARRSLGSGMVRTCGPSSGCHTHPIILRAGSRQWCGGAYFYDRMTASSIPMLGTGPVELPVETIPCAHPAGNAG